MSSSEANWKNVNNWHWVEKDCTKWSHDRLREELLAMKVASGAKAFKVEKVDSIDGDVCVTQRKGKVKPFFDLELSLHFKELDGEEVITCAVSEFTADYQDPSDLVVKTSPKQDAFDVVGLKQEIASVLEAFRSELFEVHGRPLLAEGISDTVTSDKADWTHPADKADKVDPVHVAGKGSSTTGSTATVSKSAPMTAIEDEVEFPCPADQLFLTLTAAPRISAWSRTPISSNTLPQIIIPGSPFALFDHNILGKFLDFRAATGVIEMDWKLRDWQQFSRVHLRIEQAGAGKCRMVMKQENLPAGQADATRRNWHNYYWTPIKQAFGGFIM